MITKRTSQKIRLNEPNITSQKPKKAARAELRALRDAFFLKTDECESETTGMNKNDENIELKPVNAFCISEKINLKSLNGFLSEQVMFTKTVAYYGECLYAKVRSSDCTKNYDENYEEIENDESMSIETFDVFFFEYGVTVFWGTTPQIETRILKLIKFALENPYVHSKIEVETFNYGFTQTQPLFRNDVIYLNSDFYFHKMIISCAIAQSVKLDYFEELTEDAIETVKDLPEEVCNPGETRHTRQSILKLAGKLHKLRIDLNLVTNILDEPELLWNFPKYSELYESFRRCLEIKTRADILNLRCDVIYGVLEILSENINTRNSERLEKMIISLISVSVIVGIIQIVVILFKSK